MRILLIGEKGAGKTTVCRKIIGIAGEKRCRCSGVISSQQGDGLVVEDVSTGERKLLAASADSDPVLDGIRLCSFVFSREGIEFGKRAIAKGGDLLIIDELGKLELGGKGFDNALSVFASRDKNSILVIRDKLKAEVLAKLGGVDFKTVEVTALNRESTLSLVLGMLGLEGC